MIRTSSAVWNLGLASTFLSTVRMAPGASVNCYVLFKHFIKISNNILKLLKNKF